MSSAAVAPESEAIWALVEIGEVISVNGHQQHGAKRNGTTHHGEAT